MRLKLKLVGGGGGVIVKKTEEVERSKLIKGKPQNYGGRSEHSSCSIRSGDGEVRSWG